MERPQRVVAVCDAEGPWTPLFDRIGQWAESFERYGDVATTLGHLRTPNCDLFLPLIVRPSQAFELLERVSQASPGTPVAVLLPAADSDFALRLGHAGAATAIGPPDGLDWNEAFGRVQAAWEASSCLRAAGAERTEFHGIVGASPATRRLTMQLEAIAPRGSTVLLEGATGAGKELAARAIHGASGRAAGPFVEVNCSAIPATLFESELFGHVKGSFTGAVGSRPGSFEQADGGTLFLDEVGELPLELQPKLLRVLQEREVRRVGATRATKIDVRIVAATNRDLEAMVRRGEFREDLFYRLSVVPIRLPSLAERKSDVPLLATHLLNKIRRREGLREKRLGPPAMERLAAYAWPGNVRQLENVIEKAAALSGDRPVLTPSDFALPLPPASALRSDGGHGLVLGPEGVDYDSAVAAYERRLIDQALTLAGGNKQRAANLLRLKRTTFTARLKALAASARAKEER